MGNYIQALVGFFPKVISHTYYARAQAIVHIYLSRCVKREFCLIAKANVDDDIIQSSRYRCISQTWALIKESALGRLLLFGNIEVWSDAEAPGIVSTCNGSSCH